ncbi:MAG TPA: SDR family oxidoreductase [Pseudonocardiaceae bacterium]|nr:SDR family oxidoreductase [Pseudonocardiaceae bacterium]
MTGLAGRVAVVTGASSGLGARFATVLAEQGATVVAAGRRRDRLDALADSRPGIVPVTCDVTVAADREHLIETALEHTGRLDVLVNNAGVGDAIPAIEETAEGFERTLSVNLTATFTLCTLAAKPMLAQGSGSIINISSILGQVASAPLPQAAYGTAKGGVISLTRHLAGEWAPSNVRVNAIAPGWFPSGMTDEMFANERSMRWIERNTPMRRPGRSGELDGILLLLAGDGGSYITGQTISVDGGWTAR